MNKRRISSLQQLLRLSAVAAAMAAACAHAQVATVNGVKIPQSRLDVLMKARATGKQPDTPEARNAVREHLINIEIFAQEAVKKGLQKNPEIAAQLELQRQDTLAKAFIEDYVKAHPITDDAMRKEFERIKPSIPPKEFRARHILVDKEEEAKDILAQLKKGGSFEKLAAAKSKDTGSKTRGGDLDWAPSARYVKPFAEALEKLKKGQTTDAPVKSDFGWHIIRLDDERATKVPTFEQAKPQLHQMMQNQQVQKMLAEVRAKAKVE